MSFDRKYLWPAMVSVHSLKAKSGENLLFSFGLDRRQFPKGPPQIMMQFLKELSISFSILWLETPEFLGAFGHVSSSAFNKLIMADFIDTAHVWVDADTVGLGALQKSAFYVSDGHALGMVQESQMTKLGQPREEDPRLIFNSGVVAFPAGKRRDWLAYATSGTEAVLFADQEIFNVLYAGDIHGLPATLNSNLQVQTANIREDAVIGHFLGSQKPWHLMGFARARCATDECGFSHWFEAEIAMFADTKLTINRWQCLPWKFRSSAYNQNFRAALLAFAMAILPLKIAWSRLKAVHPYMHWGK
jgi:lipopolysaccharide biosynthesis glycosyltransferase